MENNTYNSPRNNPSNLMIDDDIKRALDVFDIVSKEYVDKKLDDYKPSLLSQIKASLLQLTKQMECDDMDIEDFDIIIRKENGKYVAKIDKKRDLKIQEIFKDELK